MSSYNVYTGDNYEEFTVTCSSVSSSIFASGDIITNDKEAISNVLTTPGGKAILRYVKILETAVGDTTNKSAMDLVLFNNLATATLGLSSNAVYALDITNNTGANTKIIECASGDWVDEDALNASVEKSPNIYLEAATTTALSFSFALVSRGTPTYDNHTLKVIFGFARL